MMTLVIGVVLMMWSLCTSEVFERPLDHNDQTSVDLSIEVL